MIFKTIDLLNKGENEYSIRKLVKQKKLFFVSHGLYSNSKVLMFDEKSLITKYPNVIFTNLSAFYYYDLTDNIPNKFYVVTKSNEHKIKDKRIIQSFQKEDTLNLGKVTINYNGTNINTYNLERLLIELIRLKAKYPTDIYYEVLNSFRDLKDKLDYSLIISYLKHFKHGDILLNKIKELI